VTVPESSAGRYPLAGASERAFAPDGTNAYPLEAEDIAEALSYAAWRAEEIEVHFAGRETSRRRVLNQAANAAVKATIFASPA
jgi:hypothetical protein